MSKKRSIIVAVLVTFILTALVTFGVVRVYDSGILTYFGIALSDDGISAIKRAKDIIDREYYAHVDDDVLYQGALKGMFEALGDEYSWYVNEEEYK